MRKEIFFDKSSIIETSNEKICFYSPRNHKWIKMDAQTLPFFQLIESCNGVVSGEMIDQLLVEFCKLDSKNDFAGFNSFVDKLLTTGVFFNSREELEKSFENFSKKFKNKVKDSMPKVVYIHPTQKCNFSCWYCYSGSSRVDSLNDLSHSKWNYILNELKDIGVKVVNITGGEPLLRSDIIDMIDTCKEFSKVTLLTNGSLFNESNRDVILSKVDSVIMSLDSFNESIQEVNRSKDGFDNIISLLNFVSTNKSYRDKFNVRSVGTKENINELIETKKILKDRYSITNYIVTKFLANSEDEISLVPSDNDFKRLDESRIADHEYEVNYECNAARCGAAQGIIAIDYDGSIYPCQSFVGRREEIICNILDDDWKEKYLSSKVRLNFYNLDIDNIEQCGECSYRNFCGGGCPSVASRLYGSIHSCVEYQCDILKYNAKLQLLNTKTNKMD